MITWTPSGTGSDLVLEYTGNDASPSSLAILKDWAQVYQIIKELRLIL